MHLGRGTQGLVLLAALVVIIAGLKLAQPIVVPLLLAGFISTINAPLVGWLTRAGWPYAAAVAFVVLATLAAFITLVSLVGGSVNAFYSNLPDYQSRLAEYDRAIREVLDSAGIPLTEESVEDVLNSSWIMGMVGQFLRRTASAFSDLLLVLLIVVFVLLEGAGLRTKILLLSHEPNAPQVMHHAALEIGKYLMVKTVTSLATGVLVGVWVGTWGLDLPLVWGTLAFVLNYIPTLGSIIASIPALLLSLLQFSPVATLGIATGYLAVNFIIGSIIEPRILGRALGLSPLVVFLSMVFWGWMLGPVGAFLSVPLTMVAKIYFAHTSDLKWIALLLATARSAEEIATIKTDPPPKPAAGHDAT
ncbi:MAG: AI-2E family transporter [Myxococcota bacterium]